MGCAAHYRELLKLGIDIGETSVNKYMVRGRKPPSQTWRAFLENHLKTLVSVTISRVPTIRLRCSLLPWCRLRRTPRGLFHVTTHPATEWAAQQLRDAVRFDRVRCVSVAGSPGYLSNVAFDGGS